MWIAFGPATHVHGAVEITACIDGQAIEWMRSIRAACGAAERELMDHTLLDTSVWLWRDLEYNAVPESTIYGCAVEIASAINVQVSIRLKACARAGKTVKQAFVERSVRIRC